MTDTTTQTHLTPEELISRWRGTVSEPTLRSWRSRGDGPAFIRIGNRVLYPLADVVAYEAGSPREEGGVK
jgi:hypothetical protein